MVHSYGDKNRVKWKTITNTLRQETVIYTESLKYKKTYSQKNTNEKEGRKEITREREKFKKWDKNNKRNKEK